MQVVKGGFEVLSLGLNYIEELTECRKLGSESQSSEPTTENTQEGENPTLVCGKVQLIVH